jgi:phosphoglycerate kinase
LILWFQLPLVLSLFDKAELALARRLSFSNIVLPKDVGAVNKGRRYNKLIKEIALEDNVLDIGPLTVAAYTQFLKKAKTIVWNGPLGAFEKPSFAWGTKQIAQVISLLTKRGTFSLIGGGETVAALSSGTKRFSWVSTGGGASLAYLAGQKMPGLSGIISYTK